MLFNSFIFLGVFLPFTLITWFLLKRLCGIRVALVGLILASFVFYASWKVSFLFVLLGSISVNFWLAQQILTSRKQSQFSKAKSWLIAGLAFNLLVLFYFKYAHFVAFNIYGLFDLAAPFPPILLPLAISFVTFQKIAYLVDCYRGEVRNHDLLDYLFFVSFFPQLIAGPIVHHRPLISQVSTSHNPLLLDSLAFSAGMAFFTIGLFKKVVLADSLAVFASSAFQLSTEGVLTMTQAWQGMFAYSLQLYFDFSGYSDMAIGLALLFGFKLPINFLSPYKADSIIEFWRRWHMTLSNFLRDYLYIPLGGNRNGNFAKYRNLFLTMLLAGLWHGAAWTFVLWGMLHGLLLLANHAWRKLLPNPSPLLKPFFICCTFIFVCLAWVLFRATDLTSALHFYAALLDRSSYTSLPIINATNMIELIELFVATRPETGWIWIACGIFTVMFLPNTANLLAYDPTPNQTYQLKASLSYQLLIGALSGLCLWLAIKWIAVRPATEFLYFNF
ncbi:MBOAT family O-acyltransferase [Undibacterium baiyunense]|uniref:Probable alginate O-acetylase AlgI n=1 Tax=Undibacterium baiyunense TaxID=2828731 RepID=A0A941DKD9_9BURK|nr:MBOAT family protein [Undibacterium baiyunense]MBR7748472.1 MBOAT family protein [Undibacterium baiyunense]